MAMSAAVSMDEPGLERDLAAWSAAPVPACFPYLPVVGAYHRVGKHFVAASLLKHLDVARSALSESSDTKTSDTKTSDTDPQAPVLAAFLDVLLDKFDERYDYQTYLALSLLPMPDGGPAPLEAATGGSAQRQHDRLLVQLGADALAFELAALDGHTALFPHLRPDPAVAAKRCRLGLRSLGPALERLGLARDLEPALRPGPQDDLLAAARRICARVRADASPQERRVVGLTVLPVWISHDEYLFIRVLQAFETRFALLAVRLRAALAALAIGRPRTAAAEVRNAQAGLEESFRLFSLLATMQVASFQEFRRYTEGASAIQSRNYKLVESLCRIPDEDRLDSAAYRSVPELRERILQGPPSLDDAVWLACRDGELTPAERRDLTGALHGFAARVVQWRQTHYSLAVRMLGDRPGTGYTEGTPYLKQVRAVPVFQKTDPDC
ncbi:tryptophan 2,3-dioxygenase [Catenulispora sp. GP43]|uniref:tryptophan 2,3-dioxygenase n=1 Tax=Catenulispora sp. GP43 TaxID=3156263 RepID=UPI003510DBD9